MPEPQDRPRRTGRPNTRGGPRAGGSAAGRAGGSAAGRAGGSAAGRAGGSAAGGHPRSDRDSSGRTEQRPRRIEPPLPDDVTGDELDRAVRAELASLASLNGQAVRRHLVMAGRLLDEDPEAAYAHAVAARNRAGRVAAVREAAGLAAYATERYAEALAELRAARRMSGDQSVLPLMADCERGLGRPERALALATSPDADRLDAASRIEMAIVASGARRDLGQPDAALLLLQGPELRPGRRRPWSGRLFYAYAEALLAASRRDEALTWFEHAAAADDEGETDAEERLADLGAEPAG